MLSVPRISGVSAGLIQMGTETSCRMPPGWGTNVLVSCPLTARRTPASDSGARAARPFGQSCQHAAVPVGDEEEVGRELLLVFLGHHPRVVRVGVADRGLEPRQIGDERGRTVVNCST